MGTSLFNRLAFWQRSNSKIKLGVYVCPDKLVVYQAGDDNVTPQEPENSCEFAFDGVDWGRAFALIAKQFEPAQIQVTLSSSFYQLLLVDKPNVEAEEMMQALQWSIKDMVTQAVADIHFDYFEPPLSGSAKLNVVVVEKAGLAALVLAAKEHDMEVIGINIEEMAVTNLFIDDPQARLVLSHLPGQELLLTVVRQGELYMQRRVRGFNQLDTVSAEELAFGLADNLSLELQRSMDYFESQLRQAPVASIELLINGQLEKLAELVSANFNQKVNTIETSSAEKKMAALALCELNRDSSSQRGIDS
ncbi:MSHA biogenesis protein MshI [uncultured Shewanella sp.]|uniref:MSHA biogenesis protein MshI n=1 Tax=Shewanella atlantica TaxID=271099 RepID=UPI002603C46F|nr:MSHA biogenesis protein MshI [uncultured Shewanella sp.]